MSHEAPPDIEHSIARCRILLSGVAFIAVFIDPTEPFVSRWIPIAAGTFTMDPTALSALAAHFAYGLAVASAQQWRWIPRTQLRTFTTLADALFAIVIMVLTEGPNSPFFAFFALAVVGTGLRDGFRRAMGVTVITAALYVGLILLSGWNEGNVFIMRPVYLAIIGYLVAYLAQQRLNLEAGIRALTAANERHQIARDLHDGRAQALAGISLRIETCRELLRRGSAGQASQELTELQASVDREYDDLRSYMALLLGHDTGRVAAGTTAAPHFEVSAAFDGSPELVEQVFQILREGARNIVRHAHARTGTLAVRTANKIVEIHIDDDGIGFPPSESLPWSMASRVAELDGAMRVVRADTVGGHIAITIPHH